MDIKEFRRRKRELRETYKRFKVGLITEDDLTDEQRFLLRKYYGVVSFDDNKDDGL